MWVRDFTMNADTGDPRSRMDPAAQPFAQVRLRTLPWTAFLSAPLVHGGLLAAAADPAVSQAADNVTVTTIRRASATARLRDDAPAGVSSTPAHRVWA